MKTITINDDLWAKLSHIKIDENLDSLDSVIVKLYNVYVGAEVKE
jgi:predicted CopG family antitoxin